jgi:hypothetical protein
VVLCCSRGRHVGLLRQPFILRGVRKQDRSPIRRAHPLGFCSRLRGSQKPVFRGHLKVIHPPLHTFTLASVARQCEALAGSNFSCRFPQHAGFADRRLYYALRISRYFDEHVGLDHNEERSGNGDERQAAAVEMARGRIVGGT